MGVERRKGQLYLYDRRRVGGRPHGVYVGPVSAADAALIARRAATEKDRREAARHDRRAAEQQAAAALAAGADFERLADRVFRAVMALMGFRRHNRGAWRRRRGRPTVSPLQRIIAAYSPTPKGPEPPLVRPSSDNPEYQKLLDAAAAGDESVLPEVAVLIRDRGWLRTVGSVAWMAERALIRQAAGDDVAVTEAVRQTVKEHVETLTAGDGPDTPFAVRLAAVRVAHCWLAVHTVETIAARYAVGSAGALAVERQLASVERRLAVALRALAALRRAFRPAVVTQLNVSAGPMQVNNSGPGGA